MPGKILIVDDEALVRSELCEYLREEGYHAYEACDGREALQVIEKISVDLIVTDLIMPHYDGFQLTKAVRERNRSVPIVLLAGVCSDSDAKSLVTLGVNVILRKPVRLSELHAYVKEILM